MGIASLERAGTPRTARTVLFKSVDRTLPAVLDVAAHSCETCCMRVRVRLFASLRESAGYGEVELLLPPDATAEDAWRELAERHPTLAVRRQSLAASVNRRYAPFDTLLREGDEVVFIPPVSGG
jgi:sulfur-carrier protein